MNETGFGLCGLVFIPWSNEIKERTHANCDLTIRKMIKDKEMVLNDSLVKAVAWTHNTSVNKLGYTPLQLVTGKAVTLPGLTTGNVSTESMTDCEAVQRTMETLNRTVSEFCEADMKRKLKECQGIRTQAYQHLRDYIEVDRAWY